MVLPRLLFVSVVAALLPTLDGGIRYGWWPNEFCCEDGTRIISERKCDGIADCPDGSDEKHYLCRETVCPDYRFRCTYGACVDITAPCDGVSNCVDNSDELLPDCYGKKFVFGNQFKCDDGTFIEVQWRCDGIKHCKDGSDETIISCASNVCPANLFQCEYGACITYEAVCNGEIDCPDGSDEAKELCKRKAPSGTTAITTTTATTTSPGTAVAPLYQRICTLPRHPDNGWYFLIGYSRDYRPGDNLDAFYLKIACDPGYMAVGGNYFTCIDGKISPERLPQCVRACEVFESESITYRCLSGGGGGARDCRALEPEGSVAQPRCRRPYYYSPVELPPMTCVNGRWSYVPNCEPECGTLIAQERPLIAGGKLAYRGEVPWHAGIYYTIEDYKQICGATLIKENLLVSALHCFWDEYLGQVQPASRFAVAVGKLYRDWANEADRPYEQKSYVKKIIPTRQYRGAATAFMDDLALVITTKNFKFGMYIRPVCFDFVKSFNTQQLREGNVGKVAGSGLTSEYSGSESAELKVLDMPYMPLEVCERMNPRYIQVNKFCAGQGVESQSLCPGDSGGGIAFPAAAQGVQRFYLRGVVSTALHAPGGALCNLHAPATFEELQPHENFIMTWVARARHLSEQPVTD